MSDTQESVKKISEMGVEINTLTKKLFKSEAIEFLVNDQYFYTYKKR